MKLKEASCGTLFEILELCGDIKEGMIGYKVYLGRRAEIESSYYFVVIAGGQLNIRRIMNDCEIVLLKQASLKCARETVTEIMT